MKVKDKFKRSLLPESLRGVVIVYTGQAGAGKTVASMLDPGNTVFIDADHGKGRELVGSKSGAIYKSVNSPERENLVKTGDLFIEAIESINKQKTTVVVIDNLYEVEQGLQAYAVANPVKIAKAYNLIAGNITGKLYGHDSLAHERIIKGIIDELVSSNITVILTTHMKPKFMVKGQLEIKARRWVYEASSLVGIMVRTDSAPDMLVFKNAFNYHVSVDVNELSDEDFDKYRRGEIESSQVYQRIPRRIPAFTPTKLFKYLARSPEEISKTPYSPEELLDEDEIAPYVEILTKEQKANIEKIMENEQAERERFEKFEANVRASQRVELDEYILKNADVDISELSVMLKKEFTMFASEITPVYIMQVRQRVSNG